MSKKGEVEKLVDDLVFIKEAIKKNNSIFKYFSISRALRGVLLYSGLVVISFSLWLNHLISKYDSFQAAPIILKRFTYFLIVIALVIVVIFKIKTMIRAAQKVQSDITVTKLIKEVYTGQTLMVMIPFIITIALFIVFLQQQALGDYILPIVAILVGLLTNSVVSVFHIKELIIMGDWLIITGFITLFFLSSFSTALILAFTFGLGCIVMYFATFLSSSQEGE
ncbi:hypothetical protein [Alkaliphilus serpentinus]|uniref:Uncharacterized protein n=1 Tax=Alkaliphilus serpentinus TaxID=1482731 RepID=A0A833HPF5_9FIRM|nr:hypothetical protein [Alkaliphilus serpentinus]KAB3530710.1 hypothetical protein F8153_06265 [Alkaliphilus serpentinus]